MTHQQKSRDLARSEAPAMARSNILWARYCAVCLGGVKAFIEHSRLGDTEAEAHAVRHALQ